MTLHKVALWVGILCVGRLHSSIGVFAQDSDSRFPNNSRSLEESNEKICKDTCQELWCVCVKDCYPNDDTVLAHVAEQIQQMENVNLKNVGLAERIQKNMENMKINEVDRPDDCMAKCVEAHPNADEKCNHDACDKAMEGETKIVDFFDECDGNRTSTPSMSPAPSGIPTYTPAPSVSSAPTLDCTCCDCTHTSGCNPDPHYNIWGGSAFYDFQGACDQIAIDNDVLQLQLRTRPRNYYSTITEVGLLMKLTGEIFHARLSSTGGGADVSNNITIASGGASYSETGTTHKIEFETPAGTSFIQINGWSYGLSIQVQGQGYIFSDSVGMFGSWNHGDVRFSNGTVFDLSGGYNDVKERSFELAESWKVGLAESLMDNPSDICDASSACGPGGLFACDEVEDRRLGLGKSRATQEDCERTCDDIAVPMLREECEKDVELSADSGGDEDWACQPSYTDPVIVESNQCEFVTVDDGMCSKTGDSCQRLGGVCKLKCEDTDDHVCLPGLCSYDGPETRFLEHGGARALKNSKAKKAKKAKKAENECQCFAPVQCS